MNDMTCSRPLRLIASAEGSPLKKSNRMFLILAYSGSVSNKEPTKTTDGRSPRAGLGV